MPDFLAGKPFIHINAYFQVEHGGELSASFAGGASSIVAYASPPKERSTPGLELFPIRVQPRDVAAFDCTLVSGTDGQHARFAAVFKVHSRQRAGNFRLYCQH
jgi:hypothetical protein